MESLNDLTETFGLCHISSLIPTMHHLRVWIVREVTFVVLRVALIQCHDVTNVAKIIILRLSNCVCGCLKTQSKIYENWS